MLKKYNYIIKKFISRNQGFTLVEIVVGTGLGALLLFAGSKFLESSMKVNKLVKTEYEENVQSLTYKKFSIDFIDLLDNAGISTIYFQKGIPIRNIENCVEVKTCNNDANCPNKVIRTFASKIENGGGCFLQLSDSKPPKDDKDSSRIFGKTLPQADGNLNNLIKNKKKGKKINFFSDTFTDKPIEINVKIPYTIPEKIRYKTKELHKNNRQFIGWRVTENNPFILMTQPDLDGHFETDPLEGGADTVCSDEIGNREVCKTSSYKLDLVQFNGDETKLESKKSKKNHYLKRFYLAYNDKYNLIHFFTKIIRAEKCIFDKKKGLTNPNPNETIENDDNEYNSKESSLCKQYFGKKRLKGENGKDEVVSKIEKLGEDSNYYVVLHNNQALGTNDCDVKCKELFNGKNLKPNFNDDKIDNTSLKKSVNQKKLSFRSFSNAFTVFVGGPQANEADMDSKTIIIPIDMLIFEEKPLSNDKKALVMKNSSNGFLEKTMINRLPSSTHLIFARQLNSLRFSTFIFYGKEEEHKNN